MSDVNKQTGENSPSFIAQNKGGLILVTIAILALFVWYVVPMLYHLAYHLAQFNYSFPVALMALFIAWNNYRRGNEAIIRLKKFSYCLNASINVNNMKDFAQLDVHIQNLGIPLKRPHICLHAFALGGTISIPLKKLEGDFPADDGGSLEKGMIAHYCLRSFELKPEELSMLSLLADPETCSIAMGVYASGFLAKRFRLESSPIVAKFKHHWNVVGHRLSMKFSRTEKRWERHFIRIRTILPPLKEPDDVLRRFVALLKTVEENKAQPPFGGIGGGQRRQEPRPGTRNA